MFATDARVRTPYGAGIVLEYARQQVARGEYEERPLVHLDSGELKVFAETELELEA